MSGALVAGLLTGVLGWNAQAAEAAYSVQIERQTLTITGNAASDKLALRLAPGAPQTLEIDVNDDGSAEFQVPRDGFRRIHVSAGGGDDLVRIDEANGAFTTTTPTQINGQVGNDTLIAGSGAETLSGGDGSDLVVGNGGADRVTLGAGDDRFVWNPGDGSDVLEGQAGRDVMTVNGSNDNEQFDVSPNGNRVRVTRDVGAVMLDLGGVEEVDINALGGADRLTVNELTGTDLTSVKADLAAGPGVPDDGATDQVVLNATNGNDAITAAGSAGNVSVTGLAARVDIVNAQAQQDQLAISALDGDDVVDGSRLAADAVQFRADGGGGADVLVGGAGPDTLLGGEGDDVLIGGPSFDTLDGGPGSNIIIQD